MTLSSALQTPQRQMAGRKTPSAGTAEHARLRSEWPVHMMLLCVSRYVCHNAPCTSPPTVRHDALRAVWT